MNMTFMRKNQSEADTFDAAAVQDGGMKKSFGFNIGLRPNFSSRA